MLNKFGFILINPQLGENIGSCARALKNFGFWNLNIVSPRDPWPNTKARMTSVGAYNIIKSAKIYNNVEDAVKKFFSQIDHIDGAVNCSYPRSINYGNSFLNVSQSDFNNNVALHLGSAFLIMRECASYFDKNKHQFSLVNLASIYGSKAPDFTIYEGTNMTMPVEYAAIKSAIIHLNRYVVSFISDSSFRVNSVSPGGLIANQPEKFIDLYKKKTLGKGMLSPDDVIETIIFLLSNASQFINGQDIVVDDGFTL